MKQTLQLAGLSCQNCVQHVENALSKMTGVEAVTVSLDPQLAQVTTSQTYTKEEYQAALEPFPYQVVGVQAE